MRRSSHGRYSTHAQARIRAQCVARPSSHLDINVTHDECHLVGPVKASDVAGLVRSVTPQCHGCASSACTRHFERAAVRHNDSWEDVAWCRTNTDYTAPLHPSCVERSCAGLVAEGVHWAGERLSLGIVLVDTRDEHPGLVMWRAYCTRHGYTLIRRRPSLPASPQRTMEHDWASTAAVLDVLTSDEFRAFEYFLYTEMDQWIVRPMARLEPLLLRALTPPNVFGVGGEFPCMGVRRGGLFNMGTYLLRRSETAERLLRAWMSSTAHGGRDRPLWPARQGAFSHDGAVFWAHRHAIHRFPSGCAMGSPYAPLIAHALGGVVGGVFDPRMGRVQLEVAVLPCVIEGLRRGTDVSCALVPEEVGGLRMEDTSADADGTRHPGGEAHQTLLDAQPTAAAASSGARAELNSASVNGTVVVSVATLPEYCSGSLALAESARAAGLGKVLTAVSRMAGCAASPHQLLRTYEPWSSVLQQACDAECVWACAYRTTWALKFAALSEVMTAGLSALMLDSDWRFTGNGGSSSPLLPLLTSLEVAAATPTATPALVGSARPSRQRLGTNQPDIVALLDPLISHSHSRMINVGLLWLVSTPRTRELVTRVANRSLVGWDQIVFAEELAASREVLCCHANQIDLPLARASAGGHAGEAASRAVDDNERLARAQGMPSDVNARWTRIGECAARSDEAARAGGFRIAPSLSPPSDSADEANAASPFAHWEGGRYNPWSRRIGVPRCTACLARVRRKKPNCIGHPNACPYAGFGLAPTPSTSHPHDDDRMAGVAPPARAALEDLFVTREALSNVSHPLWQQLDFSKASLLSSILVPPRAADLTRALPQLRSCAVVGASAYLRGCRAATDACMHTVFRANDHPPPNDSGCTRTDVQVANQYTCTVVPAPRRQQGQSPWERPSSAPRMSKRWWREQPLLTVGRDALMPCGRRAAPDAGHSGAENVSTAAAVTVAASAAGTGMQPRVRLRSEWFADGRLGTTSSRAWLSSGVASALAHRSVWAARRRMCSSDDEALCRVGTVQGGEGAASTGGVALAFALLACESVTLFGFGGRGYADGQSEWMGQWHDLAAEHSWMRELVRIGRVRAVCSNLTDDPPAPAALSARSSKQRGAASRVQVQGGRKPSEVQT